MLGLTALALLGFAMSFTGAGTASARPSATIDAPAKAAPAAALPFGLFGSLEFRTNKLRGLVQWAKVVDRTRKQRARYAACETVSPECSPYVVKWRKQLNGLKGADKLTQLRKVNRMINYARAYKTDFRNFGKIDHWTTPAEFLNSAGDCEDFAITKFFSLMELGFTNNQMRIVVLDDRRRGIPHAVLSVKLNGQTYILDNVVEHLLRHEDVAHYRPIYSVNLTTRWAHIHTPQIRRKFAAFIASKRARDLAPLEASSPALGAGAKLAKAPVVKPRHAPRRHNRTAELSSGS